MSYDNFELYKATHDGPNKSPRNTATGIINSKYADEHDYEYLHVVMYTVVGCETRAFESYEENFNWIIENFHHTAPGSFIGELSQDSIDDCMNYLREQWYGTYPSDGIVLTCNKCKYDVSVEYDAIAYKYEAESAVTQVIDVEWNLSKTKYLVPRVHINTVNLSGADISYATGFNAKYILDEKIGSGASIEICRSGEVIPDIQKVIEPAEPIMPTTCPCCNANLEWKGVHLYCPNPECSDSLMQDLLIWSQIVSPKDNLGDLLKIKFFDELNVHSIDDLYLYGPIVAAGLDNRGVQYDTFMSMYNGLFFNQVKLVDAIRAINIPRFGDKNSMKLAQYPDLVRSLMDAAEPVSESYRQSVGDANFNSLLENRTKFKYLYYIIDNIDWSVEELSEATKTVVVTGKLSVKRSEFESQLNEYGFKLADSVSSETFALITDDPNSTSSKNKKASQLNIPKLSENEFRQLYMA